MTETAEQMAIGVGMAIAAGIVMHVRGDETTAYEILGAAGLTTVADLRRCGVESYDIRLLAPVLRRFKDARTERSKRAALKAHP